MLTLAKPVDTPAARAERRVWGSPFNRSASPNRWTLAVGYAGRQGIMVADGPHPDMPAVKGYNFYPIR